MGILSIIKALAGQPGALRRLMQGDSLGAVTAAPAKLRRIENMSDDFFEQAKAASAAQDAHYAKLRAKYPTNTPVPADIVQEMMSGNDAGRHIYEVTSPSRGWAVVDPESSYIAGLMSEGQGPSITNPAFNALAREYKKPHATAATQELADYYRSKGLTVNPETWKMNFRKGGLVQMKECSCGR